MAVNIHPNYPRLLPRTALYASGGPQLRPFPEALRAELTLRLQTGARLPVEVSRTFLALMNYNLASHSEDRDVIHNELSAMSSGFLQAGHAESQRKVFRTGTFAHQAPDRACLTLASLDLHHSEAGDDEDDDNEDDDDYEDDDDEDDDDEDDDNEIHGDKIIHKLGGMVLFNSSAELNESEVSDQEEEEDNPEEENDHEENEIQSEDNDDEELTDLLVEARENPPIPLVGWDLCQLLNPGEPLAEVKDETLNTAVPLQ
ncbi:hypothetical protein BGX38DRAFT_1274396 [Terfezia claveryi]|nr:hypothetical protein BGX38DRAFT_1274396 [Terfezia claveryi]